MEPMDSGGGTGVQTSARGIGQAARTRWIVEDGAGSPPRQFPRKSAQLKRLSSNTARTMQYYRRGGRGPCVSRGISGLAALDLPSVCGSCPRGGVGRIPWRHRPNLRTRQTERAPLVTSGLFRSHGPGGELEGAVQGWRTVTRPVSGYRGWEPSPPCGEGGPKAAPGVSLP